jgi:hypothetical protein
LVRPRTPLHLEVSLNLSWPLKIQQKLRITFLRLSPALEPLLHRQNGRDLCRLEDWFFPSPICSSPSAQARYAPIIHHHRRSNFLANSSAVLFDHHVPERGPHTPTRGSNAPTHGSHSPPCVRQSPPCNCCVLSFFLLCCVTFCNLLWLYCFVFSPICLVIRCFRVDLFFPFFLVSFCKLFFPVTSHLNLHGLFRRLFRFLNGVFGIDGSIHHSMCRGKSFSWAAFASFFFISSI